MFPSRSRVETAPRRRALRMVLMTALACGAAGFALSLPAVAAKPAQVYTCPMHPQVTAKQPGKCPICQMDLTPLQPDGGKTKATPRAASQVPAPKSTSATPTYTCPMHPEVQSPDPAARCPKCGMKLVPRK